MLVEGEWKKVSHFNKNTSVNNVYGLKLETGEIIC